MDHKSPYTKLLGAFFAMGLLSLPVSAAAGTIVSCSANTHSGNSILGTDITMMAADDTCITLESGANLDMGDFSIMCMDAAGCGTAIEATSPGSVVSADSGVIHGWSGPIAVGVHNAKEVKGVHFTAVGTAILGDLGSGDITRKVSDNNMSSCNDFCIDVKMSQSTSYVRDNTMSGAMGGIRIDGRENQKSGKGPDLSGNTVGAVNTGLQQTDAGRKIRFFGNTIIDQGPNTVPCDVANTDLFYDPEQWGGNTCSDPICCPSGPVCTPPFSPACSAGQPVCQ
ncbi:MAG: hypothetical protein H8E45_10865 [Proteobacteria bacterium]|nr:hypothetical protein [Pseudomonadota bacterium]